MAVRDTVLAIALVSAVGLAGACGGAEVNVEEQAEVALEGDGLNDVNAEWNEDEGVVRLRGTVGDESERQRAEQVVAGAVGTSGRIVNEIEVKPREVFDRVGTVEGCLSGQDGRYILTASRDPFAAAVTNAAGGTVQTYSYELVGDQELESYVGQKVRVTGPLQLDPNSELQVETETDSTTEVEGETAPRGTPEPQVETEEEIAIESRKLRVDEFSSLGAPCDYAQEDAR